MQQTRIATALAFDNDAGKYALEIVTFPKKGEPKTKIMRFADRKSALAAREKARKGKRA